MEGTESRSLVVYFKTARDEGRGESNKWLVDVGEGGYTYLLG